MIKSDDPKMDKFYDETPQVRFVFQLKVSNQQRPYELYYSERLDGDAEYNKSITEGLITRAQADMSNILTRLQSRDEDVEFQGWTMLDNVGQVLRHSDVLTIYVKPAPNSRAGVPNG